MFAHGEPELKSHDVTAWRPSIRFYLILMNLILLCLLFPAVSLILLHEGTEFRDVQLARTITQMRKNLETGSASLVRSMALSASQAVAGYDFTFLNIMVSHVAANDPEIIYCIIMDANRKAMAHSDIEKIGVILDGPADHQAAAMMKSDFPPAISDEGQMGMVRFVDIAADSGPNAESVMETISPVYSGARLWGVLRCGHSLGRLGEEIRIAKEDWAAKITQFKFFLISITGIFFSMGVAVAVLFTRPLVRSMRVLNEGVTRISVGDLDHQIKQEGLVCDELMRLSMAFNDMTAKLGASYQQLDEYSRSLEQKVAERTRELKETQTLLMQQAHEAGMAEMAVGILHNIGNAITPAKVGAALLIARLQKSPIRNYLHDIMARVREVVERDAALPPEEKERLTEILRLTPETVRAEYDKVIEDVQQIRDKHEHIESIIHLQMRYARLYGDLEDVDVNHLVDDALRMLDDSLRKRSVTVTRNFARVPPVRIEQAKLIQIIVNLLKNGFEAMEEIAPEERHITISTYLENGTPPAVVLAIKDTGVGFSAVVQKQLFVFGYTTKSKGSGFGLHSCANYLIANNGSISAYSEGEGKGAEFVVRLPAGTARADA